MGRLNCCAHGAPGFEPESAALARRVAAAVAAGTKSAAVAVQKECQPGVAHAVGLEGNRVVPSVVDSGPERTEKGYASGT